MADEEQQRKMKPAPSKESRGDGIPPVHREILKRVRAEYAREGDGLDEMAAAVGAALRPARERVTVLIVGNHSAGKSSLINWYVDEKVQSEGSAMETSEITFVTSGGKRDRLRGKATLRHFPHLAGLEQFEGAVDSLSSEVCTSDARCFRVVDFVDTPGLTDGHLQYRFDINNVLVWLAQRVDLVFVFFDPHGQATCARTQEVVRELSRTCHEKCHFFLTKADDIKTERDRSKTLVQLSQSLAHQVATQDDKFYGEHALEVKTIYRPLPHETETGVFNQIDDVAATIEQAVRENTQRHCEAFEADAKRLDGALAAALERDAADRASNWRLDALAWLLLCVAWAVPSLLFVYVLRFFESVLAPSFRDASPAARAVSDAVRTLASLPAMLDAEEVRYRALGTAAAAFCVALLGVALLRRLRRKVRPRDEVERIRGWHGRVRELSDPRRGLVHKLWNQYLTEATEDADSVLEAAADAAKAVDAARAQ